MTNYTIKIPVIITAPLDNPQRTYNNMVQQVTDTIANYNNSPIDQRVIVLYRKKLKRKTIKSIELINNTLPDGTPVILMRVEEYKTGHNDVYLQRQAAQEASVDSTDQLGSKKNYALLYPLIFFHEDGTVINRWCAFIYDDPSKDDSDVKNTIKTVLTRILQYKVKSVLASSVTEKINQVGAVQQIKASYVTLQNDNNEDAVLQQYEVRYKHQDSKEVVYEGVPSQEAIGFINNRELDGFQKKVISVKVSDSLSYKYTYELGAQEEVALSAIEENNCYEIEVRREDINQIHTPEIVLSHLIQVVNVFASNERV